jgi:sterol desaturase/sphingolipid hydroxylase (fatty acid hydroxylase superfamily)
MDNLFDWLFDPAMRTFYGYWVSTILIILVWASFKWHARQAQVKEFFNTSYWWNHSTQQDYFFLVFNRLLFLAIGIAWFAFAIDVAQVTYQGLTLFAPANEPQAAQYSLGLLITYTLILFILDDGTRFLLHKSMHQFKWLWRLHQVHHSATSLTPFTTYRLHPLESLLYQLRASLVHGLCAGGAFYTLGFQLSGLEIWGASLWVIVFNTLGANLRHSHIPLRYGWLEKILISPAQHQLHHGLKTMNKNYGSFLALWDQLNRSWLTGKTTNTLPNLPQSLSHQLLLKPLKWKGDP